MEPFLIYIYRTLLVSQAQCCVCNPPLTSALEGSGGHRASSQCPEFCLFRLFQSRKHSETLQREVTSWIVCYACFLRGGSSRLADGPSEDDYKDRARCRSLERRAMMIWKCLLFIPLKVWLLFGSKFGSTLKLPVLGHPKLGRQPFGSALIQPALVSLSSPCPAPLEAVL